MSDHARIAELLWGPPRRPRRGPKPGMTVVEIVDAGVALADHEGLDALTMHRIAADLGFTKMSLYRYVPGRAELLALMLDRAMGSPPDLSEGPGDWRARLHAFATAMYARAQRHPWVFDVATGARVFGPNELGWLEAGVSVLGGSELTGAERLDSIVLITGHIRTLVAQGAATPRPEEEIAAAMAGVLAEYGADYPQASAAFADAGARGSRDQALEFGLARILDGIAALMASRRR